MVDPYRVTRDYKEGYNAGFGDGYDLGLQHAKRGVFAPPGTRKSGNPHPKKRKLSAWNKFVKANSKKPRFKYRSGKLNLKKMAIAFRKTPAGKKKRKR